MKYKPLHLQNFKTFPDKFGFLVATFFAVGLFPIAPGTVGSFMGMLLFIAIATYTWPIQLAFWIALTVAAVWSAHVVSARTGTSDHSSIVIDEVVGIGFTYLFFQPTAVTLILGFVLFRFFDVLKLPPVRQIDRWSKERALHHQDWLTGFGIVADDLLAAIQAAVVLYFVQNWITAGA